MEDQYQYKKYKWVKETNECFTNNQTYMIKCEFDFYENTYSVIDNECSMHSLTLKFIRKNFKLA